MAVRKRVVFGVIAGVGLVLSYRYASGHGVRHTTVALDDPTRYVEALSFEHESEHAGATLGLTYEGLVFGCDRASGAWTLAGWLMAHPDWRGERTQQNVSEEIWAHCVAWFRTPALRARANPVNIEFYAPWPRNLIAVALAHLRRATRARAG
jgi:hypothetical protein